MWGPEYWAVDVGDGIFPPFEDTYTLSLVVVFVEDTIIFELMGIGDVKVWFCR